MFWELVVPYRGLLALEEDMEEVTFAIYHFPYNSYTQVLCV